MQKKNVAFESIYRIETIFIFILNVVIVHKDQSLYK